MFAKRWLMWAALLCAAGPARAETVEATSMTILQGRQDPRDGALHTVVPLVENLSVHATDLKTPWFSGTRVVVSAWGEVAGCEPRSGDHAEGDVDLAYIEAS